MTPFLPLGVVLGIKQIHMGRALSSYAWLKGGTKLMLNLFYYYCCYFC